MAFAFAPIDILTDSFDTFTFATFAFVFAPMKAPQYIYMLFHFVDAFGCPRLRVKNLSFTDYGVAALDLVVWL